jgi:hypothetical protein
MRKSLKAISNQLRPMVTIISFTFVICTIRTHDQIAIRLSVPTFRLLRASLATQQVRKRITYEPSERRSSCQARGESWRPIHSAKGSPGVPAENPPKPISGRTCRRTLALSSITDIQPAEPHARTRRYDLESILKTLYTTNTRR